MPITLLFEISGHGTYLTGCRKKVFFATYLARMGAWLFPSRFLNFRIFRNFRQSSVILPMVKAKKTDLIEKGRPPPISLRLCRNM